LLLRAELGPQEMLLAEVESDERETAFWGGKKIKREQKFLKY